MRPEPLRDVAASHPPTTRTIYAALRREIVTLALLPGAKLSENELALRFGTSRGPVREALIRLGEDGLIDVLPQRGSFVGRLSLPAIERARFVREALEIAVVRRAATEGLSAGPRRRIERRWRPRPKAASMPSVSSTSTTLSTRASPRRSGSAASGALLSVRRCSSTASASSACRPRPP